MRHLIRWACAIALACLPSIASAQTGTSVQFPAGWAPSTNICVKQLDGTCTPVSTTTTGATGRCWLARTLPAALGTLTALVAYDLFGSPATGIPVQVLAIPTTQ